MRFETCCETWQNLQKLGRRNSGAGVLGKLSELILSSFHAFPQER